MPKYKVITRSPIGAEKLEIYEEVIECDNVFIEQSGRYLLCAEQTKIEAAIVAPPGATAFSTKIIKWFNTDIVVECYDVLRLSKITQALSN
jgi:hypothetical protein